jgi:hypothetical protein
VGDERGGAEDLGDVVGDGKPTVYPNSNYSSKMDAKKAIPVNAFKVNHIAIVESLPANEFQTGWELAGYLGGQLEDSQKPITVSHANVSTPNEFRATVERLTRRAQGEGLRPMLHVEAHGEDDFGLHLRDGKVHWREICDALIPLNRASGFNLLLSVSACFGMNCISGVRLSRGSPCYALLGPSQDLTGSDLLGRFRSFYREIIHSQDLDRALAAINQDRLERGQMVFVLAEDWFEELMLEYLRSAAHPKEVKAAAMRTYLKAKNAGAKTTLTEIKRQLATNRPLLARHYFSEFFMVEDVPENAARFATLRHAMELTIDGLTR